MTIETTISSSGEYPTFFKKKRIDAIITLGSGQFGEEQGDTKTFSGHRITAHLTANIGESMSAALVRVYGVSLQDMNQLTSIGPINQTAFGKNTLVLAAGDDGEVLTTIFTGSLLYCQGNLQQSPNAYLDIYATAEGLAAIKPALPDSWKGDTPCWLIMSKFAADAGWSLNDLGIKSVLTNPYFSGSTLDKIRACSRAGRFCYSVNNNILTVIPKDGEPGIASDNIIDITSDTGLVNYPYFSGDSVSFRSIFNPQFQIGRKVNISGSEILQANGQWNINAISHSIESEVPGGEWFTDVKGNMKNVGI